MDKLTNETIIRTVSDDQHQIIKWIMELYCPDGFDLDPTYSKGNFYKRGIPQPSYKGDIASPLKEVIKMDSRALPFKPLSLQSVMFDPPFLADMSKNTDPAIIEKRFGALHTMEDLWDFYKESLIQFYIVLKENGVLVFKCQDTVKRAKQWMSHVVIMNLAQKIGFYPKDLFVLIANTRLIGKTVKQQHARKYHSYFWVFLKQKCPVDYGFFR